MIYTNEYRIDMENLGANNELTNKGILAIMEDVSALHSNSIGYGLYEVETKRLGWMILDWKMQVIKRPKYNDKIVAKTWSKGAKRIYAYRDFELCDMEGNVIAIATSRWILVDIDRRRPVRITEEITNLYETELDKNVFKEEMEDIKKEDYIFETDQKIDYYIQRRDIDINEHVHNLSYLDMAYEVLPYEIYKNKVFNNVRIVYKKEIVYGEKVECYYIEKNNKHIITAKSGDKINAVIELS